MNGFETQKVTIHLIEKIIALFKHDCISTHWITFIDFKNNSIQEKLANFKTKKRCPKYPSLKLHNVTKVKAISDYRM